MLLYQVIFQKQCLGLGIGHHHTDRFNAGNQVPRLGIVIGFLEITRHPFFEIFCLTDVNNRTVSIGEKVAAGITREGGEIDHPYFLVRVQRS